MSVRYAKLLFLIISFACFGAWADLSFESVPTTKHPSPASYSVEQLAAEIQMPQTEKTEPLQPTEPKSKTKKIIDTIAENFRYFIQQIIIVLKKIGNYILDFLESEQIKNASDKIQDSLTPSYVSLLNAETLTNQDSLTTLDEAKTPSFEGDNEALTKENKTKPTKRPQPTEKAFIEITDETEPDISSLNYDNQGFFKLQLPAILTALSNEMAMADSSRKADSSDISTLLTALANKTAAPKGDMKKIIPKDSNLPERLMKASENTNTLQPPTVNPIKHSTTDLVKYPPTKIDKLLANLLETKTALFSERISNEYKPTYTNYADFFLEFFQNDSFSTRQLDENSKLFLIRLFEKKVLSHPSLNGNIPLEKINVFLSSMRGNHPAVELQYLPDLHPNKVYPEKRENYPTSKQIIRKAQDILDNLKRSKVLQDNHKQLIWKSIIAISRTPTGKNILQQIPVGITFKVVPQSELGTAGGHYRTGTKEVCLSEDDFGGDFSVVSRTNLISTITHELTHAAQHALGFWPNAQDVPDFEDYLISVHFNELHALLEQYSTLNDLSEQYPLSDKQFTLFKVFKDIALRKGYSQEQARLFARNEFFRIYWSNALEKSEYRAYIPKLYSTPDTWNTYYIINSLKHMYLRPSGKGYYLSASAPLDLRYEIKKRLDIIGIDLTPNFIFQQKSFKLGDYSLTGFFEKEKFIEVNILNVGTDDDVDYISTVFKNDMPFYISAYTPRNTPDSTYTKYFHGTKTPRATYTLKNNLLDGIYKEYDKNGQQIVQIPFIKGIPHGKGWIIENGELRPLFLCLGFCL